MATKMGGDPQLMSKFLDKYDKLKSDYEEFQLKYAKE